MINILNKITLGIVILVFASQSFSMSRQYRGGDFSILIKNNEPCFYIENEKLTGRYYITLFEDKTIKTLENSNQIFRKNILVKILVFYHLVLLILFIKKYPYLIVLEADNDMSFGSTFVLVEEMVSTKFKIFLVDASIKRIFMEKNF